jgi:hypothetical protein
MEWVLRLVETETDSPGPGVDVMEISRSRDLGDIANLGLTLAEAKQLLVRVHQAVVAAQAYRHMILRPDGSSCDGGCHIKDWRLHQVDEGGVRERLGHEDGRETVPAADIRDTRTALKLGHQTLQGRQPCPVCRRTRPETAPGGEAEGRVTQDGSKLLASGSSPPRWGKPSSR